MHFRFSKTNTRRKLQNSITVLKAKNTAIDILTGMSFEPSQTVVMGGSPEAMEEHNKNIEEMQGNINNFNIVL